MTNKKGAVMPKMTKDRAGLVLKKLEVFNKLERQNTDPAGWIALQFGVTTAAAVKMIHDARALLEPERREP